MYVSNVKGTHTVGGGDGGDCVPSAKECREREKENEESDGYLLFETKAEQRIWFGSNSLM